MIRLLRKDGVIVGAEELNPDGYWSRVDILDLDTPEKPKKKSLAQEAHDAYYKVYSLDVSKDEAERFERVGERIKSLILDGKEKGVCEFISDYFVRKENALVVSKQIITYLKESI